jgi:hypothetical protein
MTHPTYNGLPAGFLKMKYRGWSKLDYDVQLLIIELAGKQDYRCAFCSERHNLEIEHDHDPEEGPYDVYTIYNVRGLACRRCNQHVWFYEQNERGGSGWDHVSPCITDSEYETYIYSFDCRLIRQHEDRLEKTCPNYAQRWMLLRKFDDWKEGWDNFPWQWHFEEIKERRHGKIRTPMQFIRTLTACMKFIAGEFEKDPNFQLSDATLKNMFRIKRFLDGMRPLVEARMKELGLNLHQSLADTAQPLQIPQNPTGTVIS